MGKVRAFWPGGPKRVASRRSISTCGRREGARDLWCKCGRNVSPTIYLPALCTCCSLHQASSLSLFKCGHPSLSGLSPLLRVPPPPLPPHIHLHIISLSLREPLCAWGREDHPSCFAQILRLGAVLCLAPAVLRAGRPFVFTATRETRWNWGVQTHSQKQQVPGEVEGGPQKRIWGARVRERFWVGGTAGVEERVSRGLSAGGCSLATLRPHSPGPAPAPPFVSMAGSGQASWKRWNLSLER